ncbi:MAG: DMT family transporter [Granulosicoccus sp.]|nr:DMT family transporter [Granulosicoccus sp.]
MRSNLSDGPVSVADRPLVGITSLTLGLFLYSVQDVVIRSMAGDYSLLQIMAIRSLVTLLLMSLILYRVVGWSGFKPSRAGTMLLRGFMGFSAYIAYYLAIVIMPLAEAVAIVFTAPIFVTIFSAWLFGEKVGLRRWSAVTLGFLAVLIMLGPQGDFFRLASGLAFVAAICYAAMILLTGFLKQQNATLSIAFYSAVAFALGSVLANLLVMALPVIESDNATVQFLVRDWRAPSAQDLCVLIGLGVLATFSQFLLVKAYSTAPMSAVAPFEYTYIIWAVLFGYWLWDELPEVWTWLGMLLLVACNLYILYREQRLAHNGP